MKLSLKRIKYDENGIFGELHSESGSKLAVTLEHSYECKPKLPNGSYICQRGIHRLASHLDQPFVTFEIMNVPGHTGILFHPGNTNDNSEGCVLLGAEIQENSITKSRVTFDNFMDLLEGEDQFELTVE